jgi:hypothetical protein
VRLRSVPIRLLPPVDTVQTRRAIAAEIELGAVSILRVLDQVAFELSAAPLSARAFDLALQLTQFALLFRIHHFLSLSDLHLLTRRLEPVDGSGDPLLFRSDQGLVEPVSEVEGIAGGIGIELERVMPLGIVDEPLLARRDAIEVRPGPSIIDDPILTREHQ